MKSRSNPEQFFNDGKKNVLPTLLNLGNDFIENNANSFCLFVKSSY